VLNKTLITIACLVLPVLWGVVVNWLFTAWRRRFPNRKPAGPPDPDVIDFQI